jgi:hypothetical protein
MEYVSLPSHLEMDEVQQPSDSEWTVVTVWKTRVKLKSIHIFPQAVHIYLYICDSKNK